MIIKKFILFFEMVGLVGGVTCFTKACKASGGDEREIAGGGGEAWIFGLVGDDNDVGGGDVAAGGLVTARGERITVVGGCAAAAAGIAAGRVENVVEVGAGKGAAGAERLLHPLRLHLRHFTATPPSKAPPHNQ